MSTDDVTHTYIGRIESMQVRCVVLGVIISILLVC
jgi:hypothetical protein